MNAVEVVLTVEELRRVTRRKQSAAQARILDALRIPYRRHPVTGEVLASRTAVDSALGATLTHNAANEEFADYAVDVEALRNYGKTPAAR